MNNNNIKIIIIIVIKQNATQCHQINDTKIK